MDPTSVQLAPNITTHRLIQDKRKRNIVIGSVMGGVVLICVVAVLVYMFVFRPRMYYGNHVMLTTIQTPMSQDPNTKKPMPSGPPGRYTLARATGSNNANATLVLNNQTSCMLVNTKLERKGLVHEGDTCLIWEPLSNTYAFINICSEYNGSPSACSAAAMGNVGNICTWNTDTKKCTNSTNMSPMVFRTLPKNFLDLMKDPSGDNAFVKGFLFNFSGVAEANKCDTTPDTHNACNPVKTNMLKIHTNYVMKSSQSFSYIVPSLSQKIHNQGGAYDPTFNWQFMK